MTRPLIIGVTEAGVTALSDNVQARLAEMDVIIAAPRFHDELPETAEVLDWPKPFSDIYGLLDQHAQRKVAILTTGDPMWYGAGASIVRKLGVSGCEVIPAVSGLQLAASRLGWPLADCEIVSIHGRPVSTVKTKLYPRARILIIAENSDSPAAVASLLGASGYGAARIHVLAHLGGSKEELFDGLARNWKRTNVPDFHIIGVECPDEMATPPGAAAPDTSFDNDGKLTKRDVRASALAKLGPFPGAVLWDIGSGSGAVSVDFLRLAPRGKAYAIDRSEAQMGYATSNGMRHGVAGLQQVVGDVLERLAELPVPDAVFIGGGLSDEVIARAVDQLRPGGVVVAHAVTLESEAVLLAAWQQHGGDLTRIGINHADPVGSFHGWRPLMPVTQWHWRKDNPEVQA